MNATEMSSRPEGDERYRVRIVERALDALEVLAEADSNGLRLSELAARLDTATRYSGSSTCSTSRCRRYGR